MGTYFTNYEWSSPNDNVRVLTSSVEEAPSNKKPRMNLTCNGLLMPSNKVYTLVLRWTGEPFPTKDILSGCYGTFCIGDKVLNAVKVLKPAYDKEKKELVLVLDRRAVPPLRRPVRFSFGVQLNDCGGGCPCPQGCFCYSLGIFSTFCSTPCKFC